MNSALHGKYQSLLPVSAKKRNNTSPITHTNKHAHRCPATSGVPLANLLTQCDQSGECSMDYSINKRADGLTNFTGNTFIKVY